eukprot:scaffold102908_cov20-Tisochrysis_lutea.AAC.3
MSEELPLPHSSSFQLRPCICIPVTAMPTIASQSVSRHDQIQMIKLTCTDGDAAADGGCGDTGLSAAGGTGQ